MSAVQSHSLGVMSYGDWAMVGLWIVLFGVFIVFTPFYKKSQRKPTSMHLAFVVALAFEMFGVPLSMYLVTWGVGVSLPPGILWQHTLEQYIGDWGMYIGFALNLIGILLVIEGWKSIHKSYWSKGQGKGLLVTTGVYSYIRHPQYTGFILITLGLLVHWTTIPLLIMWPILTLLYYRLARNEEKRHGKRVRKPIRRLQKEDLNVLARSSSIIAYKLFGLAKQGLTNGLRFWLLFQFASWFCSSIIVGKE